LRYTQTNPNTNINNNKKISIIEQLIAWMGEFHGIGQIQEYEVTNTTFSL
jgi:hypothetical protein